MKKVKIGFLSIFILMIITSCSTTEISSQEEHIEETKSLFTSELESNTTNSMVVMEMDQMFSARDLDMDYDVESTTQISLGDGDVHITKEGVYYLSGTLNNGQVIVEVSDTEKVQLILDNVNITANSTAPIYIISGDKVFITLATDSNNSLSVLGEYQNIDENNIDSVIFSKSDLTFNGMGTLSINATYGHGIVGKDDVVFASGTYEIIASSHGICANNSIRIANGNFQIESGKDGMQADYNEDDTKGFVYIANGLISIQAQQDGISASSTLQILDGEFTIYSGGGYEKVLNIITRGEGPGNTPQATDMLTDSMKGLKATDIFLLGGDFVISSYEDAIHANYELLIEGGTYQILSGDDALHADYMVTIYDGSILVEAAYEGIEGEFVNIKGGEMLITVLDDAINASSEEGCINIEGGTILLIASGDGVDSNGDFYMSGGTLMIDSNPVYTGGDGAIDVSGSTQITGGSITDENGNALNTSSSSPSRRR